MSKDLYFIAAIVILFLSALCLSHKLSQTRAELQRTESALTAEKQAVAIMDEANKKITQEMANLRATLQSDGLCDIVLKSPVGK